MCLNLSAGCADHNNVDNYLYIDSVVLSNLLSTIMDIYDIYHYDEPKIVYYYQNNNNNGMRIMMTLIYLEFRQYIYIYTHS